jgi:hypothetical protein
LPVAMALATGVEAPSSAIAQLGQLDDAGRPDGLGVLVPVSLVGGPSRGENRCWLPADVVCFVVV